MIVESFPLKNTCWGAVVLNFHGLEIMIVDSFPLKKVTEIALNFIVFKPHYYAKCYASQKALYYWTLR